MLTEDEMKGLSEQEREFIEGIDEGDEEAAAAFGMDRADAEESGQGEQDEDAEASEAQEEPDDESSNEEIEKSPEEEDAKGDDEEDGGQTKGDQDEPIELAPQDVAPKDAQDRRKALLAERAQAMRKVLDGDLSNEDFAAIDLKVQDELDGIVRAQAVDQARAQISQDLMLKDYGRELSAVLKQAKEAGLGEVTQPGSDVNLAFDRAVRMFAQDAQARGLKDVPGDLAASRDALNEALQYVLRRSGKVVTEKQTESEAGTGQTSKSTKPRQPVDRSKLPPTLAAAPVASDATVGTTEFSHLDKLEGAQLERALAKLSPEQMERYLEV